MKKILLFISVLLSALCVSAQAPSGKSAPTGNAGQIQWNKGVGLSDSSYILTNFADTATLNKGWLKGIAGLLVRVGDTSLYVRSNDLTKWIKIGSIPSSLPPSGVAGGDLTGTYPNPVLITINSNPGIYGDSTKTLVVTVDSKGRVSNITVKSILITEGQVTNLSSDSSARELLSNKTATASSSTTTYPNWFGLENYFAANTPNLQTVLITGDTLTQPNTIQGQGYNFIIQNANGFTGIGDVAGTGNNTFITVLDHAGVNSTIDISTNNTGIAMSGGSDPLMALASNGRIQVTTETLQLTRPKFSANASQKILVINPGTNGKIGYSFFILIGN